MLPKLTVMYESIPPIIRIYLYHGLTVGNGDVVSLAPSIGKSLNDLRSLCNFCRCPSGGILYGSRSRARVMTAFSSLGQDVLLNPSFTIRIKRPR